MSRPIAAPVLHDSITSLREDLGPLAWVMEDVRRSLSAAIEALRPGPAEARPARPEEALRLLRQVRGALEMVGQPAIARTVEAMAQVVAPRLAATAPDARAADPEARASTGPTGPAWPPLMLPCLERAAFAVTEYLDLLLQGRAVHAVALFPQYEAVRALGGGGGTAHPSDLWEPPVAVAEALASADAEADPEAGLRAGPAIKAPSALDGPAAAAADPQAVRSRLDAAVLRLVRTGDAAAARDLSDTYAGLAAQGGGLGAASLWPLAAAYFEGLAAEPSRIDRVARRVASRVLLAFVQADPPGPDPAGRAGRMPDPRFFRAVRRELLFGCAAAGPVEPECRPWLAAVRQAWGLVDHPSLDHASAPLGRYDPALLTAVRKRLAHAREGWSELAAGHIRHLRSTVDHFNELAQRLTALHLPLASLARALVEAAEQAEGPPSTALAMEVATIILFLEALAQAFDPTDPTLEVRAHRLAERLSRVRRGAPPEPLEPWIETLYRQASDRQTLGSVVDELRVALAGLESELDTFFRDRTQLAALQGVPGRLTQMRGVLSVLGLDLAARAALRMRDQIQSLWAAPDHPDASAWIESLGRNLSALGFLIDMLHHQPALARQLFVFDEERGELQPVMGRSLSVPPPVLVPGPAQPAVGSVDAPEPAGAAGPPELLGVFLDEADDASLRLQALLTGEPGGPGEGASEAEALAHALAGSAATVGCAGLSQLARSLERALGAVRHAGLPGGAMTPDAGAASCLREAGDQIRQLLHQFAAGFVREPDPRLLQALDALAQRLDPDPVPGGTLAPADPPADGLADDADRFDPAIFALFEEEALELLPQLDGVLRPWLADPAHPHAPAWREAALRLMHTLKGGARLAGLMRWGEALHAAESRLASWDLAVLPGPDTLNPLDTVVRQVDALQDAFEALRLARSPTATGAPLSPVAVAALDLSSAPPAQPDPEAGPDLDPTEAPTGLPASPVLADRAAAGAGSRVRVRADLLDRLMNQTGEVMIAGARLEAEWRGLREGVHDLASNVERLRLQLREAELQAETQMQSRQSRAAPGPESAGFDPLELDRYTRMQELTRMMAESVDDIATVQRQLQQAVEATGEDLATQARQTRELQRDLLRTRMVAFETVAERLHRVVRQAAQDSGKTVRLELRGDHLEIDRGVLDRLMPAVEHLLRNAVAHGIELPDPRQQAGKADSGLLQLTLEQLGNDIALHLADDGAGLDLPRITELARERGWLAASATASPEEAAEFIFRPGLSTADHLSALSGRGVGLDVVRAEVQALGGRITVESTPGAGTCFHLVVPLTTAVTHVVMMRCGTLQFGVPSSLVETVLRAEAPALADAADRGEWRQGDQAMPFYWAGALLRVAHRSDEPPSRLRPVVLLQSAAQRLALQVDEVLGHREVVVKHLGAQLSRLPGLAGITVGASGEVVLIYNPVALAAVYGEAARQFAAAASAPLAGPAEPAAPLVLVVDDSLTVRRVTQRLLQRAGFQVALACDGLQALERLSQAVPAVILSDIEMPRMDGFELVRHLRADPRWSGLPVIFITSRLAAKHREHAQALGIEDYLGKPYAEEDLLARVRRHAASAQASDIQSASAQSAAAGVFLTTA